MSKINMHLTGSRASRLIVGCLVMGLTVGAIVSSTYVGLWDIASVSAARFTPGAGILSAPVFARAGFAYPTDIKFKVKDGSEEVIHVPEAAETVIQQIVIAAGGHTGWHSHPGPVVVLIKSGQLSFYDGDDPTCTARTYSAGEAFVDSGQGHVHIARNESGSENLEVWATYFDVPSPPPTSPNNFRIDVPNPGNCPF